MGSETGSGQAGDQVEGWNGYLNSDFAEYQQQRAARRAEHARGTGVSHTVEQTVEEAEAEAQISSFRPVRRGPASGVFAAPGTQSEPKHENF